MPVCLSPCNRSLETGYQYRIVGKDVVPSEPFRFDESATRISADTASVSWKRAGVITMFVSGAALFALGAYGVNDLANSSWSFGEPSDAQKRAQAAYLTFSATALIGFFVGVGIYAANASTTVTVDVPIKPVDPSQTPASTGRYDIPF